MRRATLATLTLAASLAWASSLAAQKPAPPADSTARPSDTAQAQAPALVAPPRDTPQARTPAALPTRDTAHAPIMAPAGSPVPGAAVGQPPGTVVSESPAVAQPRIRPLAVAKWATLAGAVAAAVYGYRQNRLADSRYEDLDRLCQAQPTRCLGRTGGGAYQDAELEARYQEVKRLDRRAAVGLVGAEVGVATTVTLFLLDLRHGTRNPPNIPYNPPRLRLAPGRDGGVEMRWNIKG